MKDKKVKIISFLAVTIAIIIWLIYFETFGPGVIKLMTMVKDCRWLKMNRWFGYPALFALGITALCGIIGIFKLIIKKVKHFK